MTYETGGSRGGDVYFVDERETIEKQLRLVL